MSEPVWTAITCPVCGKTSLVKPLTGDAAKRVAEQRPVVYSSRKWRRTRPRKHNPESDS